MDKDKVFLKKTYLCGMKKRWLQISASLMALVVLFVSVGWDVKFHYCTIDHELSGSFIDASANCIHCMGHHHDHEMAPMHSSDVVQFNSKCCCDDFDQLIRFTDNYVFSSEKHIDFQLQPSIVIHIELQELTFELRQTLQHFTTSNVPIFSSCRKMLIFLSSLKLNPLVF